MKLSNQEKPPYSRKAHIKKKIWFLLTEYELETFFKIWAFVESQIKVNKRFPKIDFFIAKILKFFGKQYPHHPNSKYEAMWKEIFSNIDLDTILESEDTDPTLHHQY